MNADHHFDPEAYADELQLPESGRRDLLFIAANEPGRAVRSGPHNSSVRAWSDKGEFAVQDESRTLEWLYQVLIEHDDDVLIYYDQPPLKVKLVQRDPDGKAFPIAFDPDFAVCRRARPQIVLVMRRAELEEMAAKHPGFYVVDESDVWHCPGGEAWAAERGFELLIVTEREIDKVVARNWLSLSDAARSEPPARSVLEPLIERVAQEPGMTLGKLGREGFDVFAAKWAIAHGRLYVDLRRHAIDSPDHTPVHPSREVAEAIEPRLPASWAIGGSGPSILSLLPGIKLMWGDLATEVLNVAGDTIWLRSASGRPVEMSREGAESMWRAGSLRPNLEAVELAEAARNVALDRYRRGGRKGLEVALQRRQLIDAFIAAKADSSDPRWSTDSSGKRRFADRAVETIEGWMREQHRVEAVSGDPLAGLVPAANPGNRNAKIDERVLAILEDVIKELYLSPDRKSVRQVVNETRRRCLIEGFTPPHARSIRARLKRLPPYATARARLGSSVAYAIEPHTLLDPDAPPPNGSYPCQVLHIDYTIADQESIDAETGTPLGRLCLGRGFDGYTGRECTHLWSYDQPSGTMVLRLLVRYAERFGRLPEIIVLDLDPANRTLELLAFCEAYRIVIVWRRTRKGRDGWRVERPFGTLNNDLFYALTGNNQASKNPRQVTKENNPRLRSLWDLAELDGRYREVRDARDKRFEPLHGCSFEEAWQRGLVEFGVGRLVRVDERMRFLAMPYADGVTRVIHPSKGVVVNYLRYEAPEFAERGIAHSKAEVRVDPDDISRVVVLVDGRHIEARCRAIAHLRVTTREELALLSERIRRDQRIAGRLQTEFEKELAEILARAREWENTRRAMQIRAEQKAGQRPSQPAVGHEGPEEQSDVVELDPYWDRRWNDVEDSSDGKEAA